MNSIKCIPKNTKWILYLWIQEIDYIKQSATDVFKTTSKKVIHKIAEATGDLMGNKIGKKN